MAHANSGYRRLSVELEGNSEALVRRCTERYLKSTVRLTRKIEPSTVARLLEPILGGLAEALRGDEGVPARLVPGTPNLRELEKSVGFTGAVLASSGASGFDVGALILSLRDVLVEFVDPPAADEFSSLLEWLTILAVESFSTAGTMAERERMREQLERGIPTVFVVPGVPAALLVASPSKLILDQIFARMVLMVVRVGAQSVIIDATGLADPLAEGALDAFQLFCEHPKIVSAVELVLVGLGGDAVPKWQDRADASGARSMIAESFDEAVLHSLDRAGYRLVRNP